MEKIIAINEYENGRADGFEILTTQQTIKLLISNSQGCCENWGYFLSEDNLQDFIGANLLNIKLTDTVLNKVKFDEIGFYEGGLMFVDIETSNGVLQFVAYRLLWPSSFC